MDATPKVYAAIAAVMAELGKEGISKDRKNAAQGFSFRGVDDVLNALNPILSRHKLCMLPRFTERVVVEHTSSKGTAMFYVTVRGTFVLACAEDGSTVEIATYGEAQDSADKATNKAMSAAYKYAAFQAFAIPTEGDNDADAHSPPAAVRSTPPAKSAPPVPDRDAQMDDLAALRGCKTLPDLTALVTRWRADNRYPAGSKEREQISKVYEECKAALQAKAA